VNDSLSITFSISDIEPGVSQDIGLVLRDHRRTQIGVTGILPDLKQISTGTVDIDSAFALGIEDSDDGSSLRVVVILVVFFPVVLVFGVIRRSGSMGRNDFLDPASMLDAECASQQHYSSTWREIFDKGTKPSLKTLIQRLTKSDRGDLRTFQRFIEVVFSAFAYSSDRFLSMPA
jgi:hypothetical protein